MKLVHPDFLCQIELPEDKIPVLILENPNRFCQFAVEIQSQANGEDGGWVLSEKGKPLKFSKVCEPILNPLALDMNHRKLVTALYQMIEKEVFQGELVIKWNQLSVYLEEAAEELISAVEDYHLAYRKEMEIKDYLKFMDVRFEDDAINISEKLIDYMDLASEILGIQLFILFNIKSFVDYQNMQYLYEQALYHKYHLLVVENHVPEEKNMLENRTIIDKDDCVIEAIDI